MKRTAVILRALNGVICIGSGACFVARGHWQQGNKFEFGKENIGRSLSRLYVALDNENDQPPQQKAVARLVGMIPNEEEAYNALVQKGFAVSSDPAAYDNDEATFYYKWNSAVGMLQLVSSPPNRDSNDNLPPQWIPLVQDQENVLIRNGWSFLDVDESEAMSAFDIDAANLEGSYKPKWGEREKTQNWTLSTLGFSIAPLAREEVLEQSKALIDDVSMTVLLDGKTDPSGRKQTHNGYKIQGSTYDLEDGVFCCAIGNLPLFTTADLSVTTASSGWLSFVRPICKDHVLHISPIPTSTDQRIEVVCAKSMCHLGHYFGPSEGYCINASCLNLVNSQARMAPVVSHTLFESFADSNIPSHKILKECAQGQTQKQSIVLGGGCFWHIEFAIRRLPGVISTCVGYAGGTIANPTYEDVCKGDTGHAETVWVDFDPEVLSPRVLVDCFLALHDPTKVRAHGKHAARVGQYRSCIFVLQDDMALEKNVREAVETCHLHLDKDLSTDIRTDFSPDQFWQAEDRHQRHDERKKKNDGLHTLSLNDWLELYGSRTQSIVGSAPAIDEETATMQFLI